MPKAGILKRTIKCCVILFFLGIEAQAGELDFTNAIHYEVPTNVLTPFVGTTSPSARDDYLSVNFLGCEYLSRDRCSSVMFQVGLIGADVMMGTVIRSFPADAPGLKGELERYFQASTGGRWQGMSPSPTATVGKINGRLAVSLTALGKEGTSSLFHFCWIEVETNLALKITAMSCNPASFKILTNSFQSIRIDAAALRAAMTPKKPELSVSTNILDKVETGYFERNGARAPVFVFRCRGKTYSFAYDLGAGAPDLITGDIKPWLEKLRDASADTTTRRIIVMEIKALPQNLFERNCHFIIEPVSTPLIDLDADPVQRPTVGVFTDEWDDKLPEGFVSVAEYPMSASLIFRRKKGD